MPLPPTVLLPVSCFSKSRLVFPFWYRLTQVVPDKGPLNVCVCVCVCARVRVCVYSDWLTRGQHQTGGQSLISTTVGYCRYVVVGDAAGCSPVDSGPAARSPLRVCQVVRRDWRRGSWTRSRQSQRTTQRLERPTLHSTLSCYGILNFFGMPTNIFSVVTHTHTHTHARLTALCPGLPGWAGTRKVKPVWILLKQETVSGSGISWAVCKSAPRSRHLILMPAPNHSVFYWPDALPLPLML